MYQTMDPSAHSYSVAIDCVSIASQEFEKSRGHCEPAEMHLTMHCLSHTSGERELAVSYILEVVRNSGEILWLCAYTHLLCVRACMRGFTDRGFHVQRI